VRAAALLALMVCVIYVLVALADRLSRPPTNEEPPHPEGHGGSPENTMPGRGDDGRTPDR